MRRAPRVLDLFSGAGGLSCGLAQAGYEIAAGVDLFPQAVETFKLNHPKAKGLAADICKTDISEIEAIADGPIDVIVGGPSCQGFSTAGGLTKSSGREENDPRNTLFNEYLKVVNHFRPSWVMLENVTGLLLYRQGAFALSIVRDFKEIGYSIVPMILLAADYGVPQLRRRLVFIGNRTGKDISFPVPTHGDSKLWQGYSLPFAHLSRMASDDVGRAPHVTFLEACGDLPELQEGESQHMVPYGKKAFSIYQKEMRKGVRLVRQHEAFSLSDLDRYAAINLRPGDNWRALIEHNILPERFNKIRPYDATTMLRRLELNKPAYTITTKFNEATTGAFIHPTQSRTLSIREAARIQSFPDNFLFAGSGVQIRTQIGNAVPPLLAKALGEAIYPDVCADAIGVRKEPVRETIKISNDISEEEILQLKGANKKMHGRKKKGIDGKQLKLVNF